VGSGAASGRGLILSFSYELLVCLAGNLARLASPGRSDDLEQLIHAGAPARRRFRVGNACVSPRLVHGVVIHTQEELVVAREARRVVAARAQSLKLGP
jgi:hypothetical protein